jgi:hypothetical protein
LSGIPIGDQLTPEALVAAAVPEPPSTVAEEQAESERFQPADPLF